MYVGLKENALHRLIGSGTSRSCGFVVVGVAYSLEVDVDVTEAQKSGHVAHTLFLLPSYLDVELSATTLAPFLGESHMMITD